MRIIFLTILFLYTLDASAEIRSRNELGIGMTDNANLESTDRDSDMIMKVATVNYLDHGPYTFGLRLGFLNYNTQDTNDVFSWRLSASGDLRSALKGWKAYVGVYGNHYPQGAPGTTDTSFDNVGFDVSADRVQQLTSKVDMTFGPGYQFRRYTQFDNRTDHTFFGFADFDFLVTPLFSAGAHSEIGLMFSSLSEYSRSYFEFGGNTVYNLSRSWDWLCDLTVRYSGFFHRTISQNVVTTNRRGIRATSTKEEQETYSNLSLSTEFDYKVSSSATLAFSLNHITQDAKSGTQNYSATEIMARGILTF
jgi:hypothetical protein